jgi:hypothetical protein
MEEIVIYSWGDNIVLPQKDEETIQKELEEIEKIKTKVAFKNLNTQ